jgi:hypothetical protein
MAPLLCEGRYGWKEGLGVVNVLNIILIYISWRWNGLSVIRSRSVSQMRLLSF